MVYWSVRHPHGISLIINGKCGVKSRGTVVAFYIPISVRREAISEGKTKIAQHKEETTFPGYQSGNQNQTRVNWAEPALTVSGRFGLYFIVVINFLPFIFSR